MGHSLFKNFYASITNMVLKPEIFKVSLSNVKPQFFHIFQNIT